MGLTDKSTIPLNIHDLRIIEGEPRFNDGRLATRLGLARRKWRELVQRHEAGAQARGLGTLSHGGIKSIGGRPSADWFLTIEQTIYFVPQSETKNALDVLAEVAKIVGALRRGAPIPDTPLTDALFAPDKPTITRGDGNVVHVKHEKPVGDLFEAPLPAPNKALGEPLAHNANKRDVWIVDIEDQDGVSYVATKERDAEGNVCLFDYLRNPPIPTSTDGFVMIMPWINGRQVRLRLSHIIPFEVIARTYLNQLPDSSAKEIELKQVARNTLRWFLAF